MRHFLKPTFVVVAYAYGAFSCSTSIAAEELASTELELLPIVIEGQKIKRTKQDTAESVEVYDANRIADAGNLDDFTDLLGRVSNVTRNGPGDYSIRGISSSGVTNNGEGGRLISVTVDGAQVPVRVSRDNILSLWDMEQVEVLRGPQSTNQGRNSLAGAIVLRSADPEFANGGRAKVSYATANTMQFAFAQTGAINDNWAYRLSGDLRQTDGHVNNPGINGEEWDKERNTTLRGKLLRRFDNGAELLLSVTDINIADYGDDNIKEQFGLENRQADDNYPSTWFTDSNQYLARYTQDIDDRWAFTSNTTYIDAVFDRDSDADAADNSSGTGVLVQDTEEENLAQEFLFNYEGDNALGVIGFYYQNGSLEDAYTTENTFSDLGFPLALSVAQDLDTDFENTALFGNFDIKLSDDWTLLTGLRIDYEQRDTSSVGTITRNADYGNDPTANPIAQALAAFLGQPGLAAVSNNMAIDFVLAGMSGSREGEDDFVAVLPKLGLRYDWSEDVNTSFVVQRGYRAGGVSINIVQNTASDFDAEYTTNYEFGLRTSWLDNALNLNANLFYTDWTDQQVSVTGPTGSPFDVTTVNAASSALWGGEIDLIWRSQFGLALNAGIGYTKTEFDDFQSFSGNEFADAPRLTANLGAHYRHSNGLFLGGQARYVDEAFSNADNDPALKTDARTVVDLKLGVENDVMAWSLFVNNVFDELYAMERYRGGAAGQTAVVGDPRVIGFAVETFW